MLTDCHGWDRVLQHFMEEVEMVNSVGEISRNGVDLYGDKTALIIEKKRFSFREIDQLACRIANGLQAAGVEAGDRVTLYSPNCWEWVVSYYGIA